MATLHDPLDGLPSRIVACALAWRGTRFVHQGAVKGVGVDCLQLVAAVGRESGALPADFALPTVYPRGWFLRDSRYVDLLLPYLAPIEGTPEPGDVALFRVGRAPAHAGIVVAWPRVVHADPEAGVVVTDALDGGTPGPFVLALRSRALMEAI